MKRARLLEREVFDLTQPLAPWSPRSSDHPPVTIENLRWYSRHGVHTSVLRTSVHVGTHIDAPTLYFQDGLSIDQLPLDSLCGPGVILDMPSEQWAPIGPAELENGPEVKEGDIVILRTGWHRFYGDEERYVLKAPGLTREGVDWLVEKGVKLVGADSPSPEHIFMRARQWRSLRPDIFEGAEIDEDAYPRSYGHKTFFRNGIFLLEGLGGEIDEVVGQRVEIIALPLKLEGAEAAQARVLALR